MSGFNRNYYVDLIEHRYFGGVMNSDFKQISDSFNEGARVLIRHGDGPPRQFAVPPITDGTDNLMKFYEHICGEYEVWFRDFLHYVDEEHDRAASRFRVRLTPKPGGEYDGEPVQELMNCNFFDFRDGRIEHMIIYYSNPEADQASPTGYPKL